MSPNVSEIESPLAYRLRLIHRAPLLREMADKNSKTARSQYKKNYNKHFRFEPRFATGSYVLIECLSLMVSAADQNIYRTFSKLFLSRLEPYRTSLLDSSAQIWTVTVSKTFNNQSTNQGGQKRNAEI